MEVLRTEFAHHFNGILRLLETFWPKCAGLPVRFQNNKIVHFKLTKGIIGSTLQQDEFQLRTHSF